ncbi:MAG TPA: aminotransferase class I/II-fold pyridoxal phosphate-dependent enzyme [Thermoleophilaceae bacterium]
MSGTPADTTIFTTMTALAESTGAINLGQGFPDEDGPRIVVDAAVEALRSGHNQYAPLPGIPALRRAIAEHQRGHYGIELDPDTQVQVTFGATEALASALLALVRPGDEVAMLDPSYDSYAAVVRLAGGVPRPIPLEPPAWRVERHAVEAVIGARTRVLLVNSPHNPTGRVLDADELDVLADACRRHDVVALTDEVYEHLIYDGGRHIPIATCEGMAERTITVSSLGKTHSFTGWKIGWATGPAELVSALRGVKQFLTFAGGTPLQHAAAVALQSAGDDARALAASLAEKRDLLAEGLRAAGFDVLHTSGTYFLTADIRPLGSDDAVAFCERLPHEAGVVGIPISAFTAAPADRVRPLVRFAFCKRGEVLEEAVARLRRAFER